MSRPKNMTRKYRFSDQFLTDGHDTYVNRGPVTTLLARAVFVLMLAVIVGGAAFSIFAIAVAPLGLKVLFAFYLGVFGAQGWLSWTQIRDFAWDGRL